MKTIPLLLAVVVVVAAVGILVMRTGKKDRDVVSDTAVSGPEKSSSSEVSPAPSDIGVAVLTEYGAEWCTPCKELRAVLQKIGPQYSGTLTIREIDVEKDPTDIPAISRIGFVGNVPFLVLRSASGEVLWSATGYMPENKLVQILSEKGVSKKN